MSTGNVSSKIVCPHCQAVMKAPAIAPGSTVSCPKCSKPFKLGAPSGQAPSMTVALAGAKPATKPPQPNQPAATPPKQQPATQSRPPAPAASAPRSAPQKPRPPANPQVPVEGDEEIVELEAGSGAGSAAAAHQPPPPPNYPPLPADDGFVPLDYEAAARSTAPAHRPPQAPAQQPAAPQSPSRPRAPAAPPAHTGPTIPTRPLAPLASNPTVDPLVLGPQPRPKQAEAKEVAVVCRLCGTRMHAPKEKIGQTIQCPDCHTVNQIKAKQLPPPKKSKEPSLDDTPDYGLSETSDRPGYRPLIAPQDEYRDLSVFVPTAHPPGWTPPVGQVAMTPAPASAPVDDDDDDDGFEVKIADPVDRIEPPKVVIPVLPPPSPDEVDLYDGKYDDGLIGDNVDRKQPEAWKKAPFVWGIVEFLFYGSTLPRWLLYSLGLAILVNMSGTAIDWLDEEDLSKQVACFALGGFSVVFVVLWVPSFAANMLAIIQDTANGMDEVSGWPEWGFDWFGAAMIFPAATFVSALPGLLLSSAMQAAGVDPTWGAFAVASPIVFSWMFLFPFVIHSMLAENSMLAVYSHQTALSWKVATDAWVIFYLYSMVMGILLVAFGGMAASRWLILNIPGAFGVITVLFLYGRLMGRLMWYSSAKVLKWEQRQAMLNQ